MDMDSLYQIPLAINSLRPEHGHIPPHLLSDYYSLHEIQDLRVNKRGTFLCYLCHEPVSICAMPLRKSGELNDHSYYFRHLPGRGLSCNWKSDASNKAAIYNGIKEGVLHKDTKKQLAETLNKLPNWEIDVDKIDTYFLFSPDKRQRGKPDVHAIYKGKEVVFEIQLRSDSPETILRRKSLYKDSNRQLIWVSRWNDEIVSDWHSDNAIGIKQVQKDIAFTNRGNWLIFDKDVSDLSIKEGALHLRVVYWDPKLVGENEISYNWESRIVTIDELTHENGETYYQDFYKVDGDLKAQLAKRGKDTVIENICTVKIRDYSGFIAFVKSEWPTVDLVQDDEWLSQLYISDHNRRLLAIKNAIMSIYKHDDIDSSKVVDRWKKLVIASQGLNFGMSDELNRRVIQKLLMILGYDLTSNLNVAKKQHCGCVHYFFNPQFTSFTPFNSTCRQAIELSHYKDQIINDSKIQKRLTDWVPVPQQQTYNRFLEWFMSEPILPIN